MVNDSKAPVKIRCDAFINLVKELNQNSKLKEILGEPVCEHLVVAAEGSDLRLEEGGVFDLSSEEKEGFLRILQGFVGGGTETQVSGGGFSERVRIRCDVFAEIIRELCSSHEIRSLFGGNPVEFLYVVADGNDLRIESGDSVTLTEDQNSVFLKILEQVIEDNTST